MEHRCVKEKPFSFCFWGSQIYTKAWSFREVQYRGKCRLRGWKSSSRLWTLIIQISLKSKCQLNTAVFPFWFGMNHLLSFLYKISFLWNSYHSTVQKGEHPWGKQEQCIVKLLESTCCIARWNYRLTVSWNVSALSATQFALQSYWAVCGACGYQKIQPLMQWKPIMIPTFSLQVTVNYDFLLMFVVEVLHLTPVT